MMRDRNREEAAAEFCRLCVGPEAGEAFACGDLGAVMAAAMGWLAGSGAHLWLSVETAGTTYLVKVRDLTRRLDLAYRYGDDPCRAVLACCAEAAGVLAAESGRP